MCLCTVFNDRGELIGSVLEELWKDTERIERFQRCMKLECV